MKRNEIEKLLPDVFQRTVHPINPIHVILEVMEMLHDPDESVLENFESYFDPYRAPDDFVFFLAGWVDLERFLSKSPQSGARTSSLRFFPTGVGRLRELVLAAAYLSKWRGTRRGLQRFLETAIGIYGFEILEDVEDENGRVRPFHILVRAPTGTERYRTLIEQIIEMEKPVYVTSEIEFIDEGEEARNA